MSDVTDVGDPGPTYWHNATSAEGISSDPHDDPSDAEFRLFAENLPILCWIARGDGYIYWYNRCWHEYCGTTPTEMEGWGWRAVHDPALLPDVEKRWIDAIATGQPFEMTFPLRGADGVYRPFKTRAAPVRDGRGEVRRWFGVNSEVSDLVATEREARSAEARLRRVLDGMGEGFALLDHDYRIIDVNAEALRLEQRPRDELVGKTHWAAYPGSEGTELGCAYKQAMTERVPVALDHQYQWEDGRRAWLEMRAFPVEEGLAIFYRDVTQRHDAEQALKREAERVQLALDAGAIIGTWDWDVKRDSFAVDERFAIAFGLDPKLGRAGLSLEQVISTVHPEDRAALKLAIEEVISRGGRYAHQYRVRRADGQYYWIEANGRVDRGDDGEFVRFPGVLLDVENRRAVEQERDQALALLRTFTEAVPGVVYAKDRSGRMLVANRGTAELIGKPIESFLGKTDAEFLEDKEQAAAVMANDARVMAQGQVQQLEEAVSFPDGRRAIWLSTKAPLRAPSGEVIGLVGTSVDVSQRVEAEQALRETTRQLEESEARFRFALDAAGGIGTWDWDMREDRVYGGQHFAQMFGIDPDRAAAGLPLSDYVSSIHPEDRARVAASIDAAIRSGGEYREEYRIAHSGDDVRWVTARGRCVTDADGTPLRFPGAAFDITDRKASEATLREVEERLRLATEAAEVGFWDVDVVNDVLIWPPIVKAMFGISADQPVSMADFYQGLHPDDRARTTHAFAAATDPDTRALYDVEYRTVGKEDQRVRWVAAKGRGVFDSDGRCIRVIGTAIDVTRRKKDEAALRELTETLERRVAEALAEREEAQDALRQSQKMEAVGQLTGGIAHDFNNLLTIVTGNIDMAGRALDAAGVSDPRCQRALGAAMKGAERAAALTQRLLAFSRKQPLAPKPIDIDKLVAGMSDMLNRTLGETIRVEIVTSPGLWRVEADPNQLEAALLNLAVNARDAMPDGGTLTIETANARLDDAYAANHAEVAPGNYTVISVTDTGKGMDRDTLSRVFEPFFTTKDIGKGTGLGLSQVYGFTKQSGGHVKLYSEEGHGTTVKIYLPRLMSDLQVDTGQEALAGGLEVSRQQETVLAVEDDDDVRAYTVECLRELGYRVLEAHDGPSAVRLMDRQGEPIDLLFTDVVMPDMSGRELADELRKRQPDLKVLYTSGYTKNAIVHGGRLDEGVEMLPKPFTFQALAMKVRDMLESGRTQRVLIVEAEPTVRAFVAEAVVGFGYAADEAATAAEALMKVRAAQGRYDVIVLDADLPDKRGDALMAELRALYSDMPMLIACADGVAEMSRKFAADRCTGVLPKPYTAAKLAQALRDLGLRCATASRTG